MKTQILSILILAGTLFTSTASASYFINKETTDAKEIKVYPNPVKEKGTLHFTTEEAGPLKIEIFDLTGKKVKVIKRDFIFEGENKIKFDAEEMSEGFYFFKITTSDWVKTTRILIRR